MPTRTTCLILTVLLAVLAPDLARAQGATDAYYEFLMARRLESEGDNRGALQALERAAAADPRSAEVKAEIAGYYLRRNQRTDAEKAARAALAIDEKNVEANRVLGQILAAAVEAGTARTPAADAERNLRDAIMHLERVIAGSAAPDVSTQYTLGRLYIRSGATDKAIQSLTRVLGQNPNSVQGRLALSQAYAAAKDLKSAMSVLEEILEEDPRVADPLGRYQEQAGLFVEAATTYSLALQVRPNDADLKFRRVAALYSAKEFGRAAGFAGDARKQHPDDPRFPRFQARALFDAGDRTGAISVMESTAKAFPKDSSTQYALADLYSDAGRHQEAETVLRQVLAADPNNPNALNYLGYLLAVRGDQLDEAIRLVRRALDVEPDNGAYLDSLGWAYFRRGDLNEAEKYLGAAVERLPGNSEVHDHLGDLHARRGRLAEAIAAWTRALEADGQDVDRAVLEKKIGDARAKLRR